MSDSPLQTEFEFTLPKGYVDDEGTVHTEGRMRLATAADEIKPLNHPEVQKNGSYMTIVLLSRVVTKLGTLDDVTPEVIESLFVTDLAHLQQLYERVNNGGADLADVGDLQPGTVDSDAADATAHRSEAEDVAEDADPDPAAEQQGNGRPSP